ncbi:hypothetical protein RF11_03811 [Thelohanellus kitauei]|uniref:Uncharacterized protein n=1 Tax=Thelohanellus kitauei TaxID=669202 RepID=A0A0C2JHW4_THEKT|nr:hypothetical protein RF11_03811 [Thelohanellus kitauei]
MLVFSQSSVKCLLDANGLTKWDQTRLQISLGVQVAVEYWRDPVPISIQSEGIGFCSDIAVHEWSRMSSTDFRLRAAAETCTIVWKRLNVKTGKPADIADDPGLEADFEERGKWTVGGGEYYQVAYGFFSSLKAAQSVAGRSLQRQRRHRYRSYQQFCAGSGFCTSAEASALQILVYFCTLVPAVAVASASWAVS